jgi:hypothetical protein
MWICGLWICGFYSLISYRDDFTDTYFSFVKIALFTLDDSMRAYEIDPTKFILDETIFRQFNT